MSTLILACILNVSSMNAGTVHYMPVHVPAGTDVELVAAALRSECVKTFGDVDLAYLVKE